MDVLIVAASRHGSTNEIADALQERMRTYGFQVEMAAPEDVSSLEQYDAVIVGSAVYAGNWLKTAREFVATNADVLAEKQVWLFSSGPLDDDGQDKAMPAARIDQLASATGSHGHHLFAGRLDPSDLNRAERLITKIVHAPAGDFRDWDDVARWADEIAAALESSAAPDR